VGLGYVWSQRIDRRTWQNTAKIEDWLPKLRTPLLAALTVYGLLSFAIRFQEGVLTPFQLRTELGHPLDVTWPGFGAALAGFGLLAALLASMHQSWWQPMSVSQRRVWGSVLVASVAFSALAFAHWASIERFANRLTSSDPKAVSDASDPPRQTSALDFPNGADSARDAGTAAAQPAMSTAPVAGGQHESEGVSPLGADAGEPEAPPPPPGAEIRKEAPMEQDIAALRPAPEPPPPLTAPAALQAPPPAGATGENPDVLLARALDDAQRPRTLLNAVLQIERALTLAPDKASNPDVERILRRALSQNGDTPRAALRVMSTAMGSRGPDLLYDLMLQKPSLASTAKFRLSRFRVRKLFSPELAVAYDLRFSPNCSSRLWLLPRAEEVGDQRAINTLSALISKSPKCTEEDGIRCLAVCPNEAPRFARAIDTIVRRLRSGNPEGADIRE
jgi:hypothetical protein